MAKKEQRESQEKQLLRNYLSSLGIDVTKWEEKCDTWDQIVRSSFGAKILLLDAKQPKPQCPKHCLKAIFRSRDWRDFALRTLWAAARHPNCTPILLDTLVRRQDLPHDDVSWRVIREGALGNPSLPDFWLLRKGMALLHGTEDLLAVLENPRVNQGVIYHLKNHSDLEEVRAKASLCGKYTCPDPSLTIETDCSKP
jgi:hypothetical protein